MEDTKQSPALGTTDADTRPEIRLPPAGRDRWLGGVIAAGCGCDLLLVAGAALAGRWLGWW